MGSTLRIIFAICLAPFLLSGCSLFGDAVITCDEPQEYQESVSMPPLIVPDYLKNIQDNSIFNINNSQGSNAFVQGNIVTSQVTDQFLNIPDQINQMENIEGDELSELLQLIDQTISNRQVAGQYEPVYKSVTNDSESDSSLEPCLDQAPRYFTEKIIPRSMPAQTYTQPSVASETAEGEKSRRQKRREARQQKADKKSQEETKEDTSSKDSEISAESEEKKTEKIFKIMTEIAIGLYTGGLSRSITLRQGTGVTPPEPIKPGDTEIIDSTTEIDSEGVSALANKIRNLAVLNSELNDEQHVFIKNMSDKQILEMFDEAMQNLQNQKSEDKSISDDKEISEKISTTSQDD